MKEEYTAINAPNFYQPLGKNGFSRKLDGDCEIVEFLEESTVRIWYNDLAVNFESHWHTATEIILPVMNSYTVNVGNVCYHLNIGDILVIPPGELHELIAPSSGARFIYLFDISSISKLKGFSTLHPLLNQPILITSEAYPKIYEAEYNLLLQIRNEYFAVNNLRELAIYSMIISFYVQIGCNHYETDFLNPYIRPNKQKEYIEKFNEVLDYIDNHYMVNITLESVAKSAGFSKFHFTRLFKQYTDTTFYDYLIYKRIKVAQDLLSRPELSITEIAYQSGFSTISTFNRIFRKLKNCTPTGYRIVHSNNHKLV
jgi:AraC-like DNA-binding protein